MTSSEDDSVENESFQPKNSSALNNPVIRLKVFFFMTWNTVNNLSHSVLLSDLKKINRAVVCNGSTHSPQTHIRFAAWFHYMARNYLTVT